MELYTIQMGQWRKAKELGVEVYDITLKSGDTNLAPDYELLKVYKAKRITDQQYTKRFFGLIDARLKENPDLFKPILDKPKVALMCFCNPDGFCHRFLLADYLEKHYKAKYVGEIRKDGLRPLVYPALEDQLTAKRYGIIWDGLPTTSGLNVLAQLYATNPTAEFVVMENGAPNASPFLSYASERYWFARRFFPEDEHAFFNYCTHLLVFSNRKNYHPPISWERQRKPTRILTHDTTRTRH